MHQQATSPQRMSAMLTRILQQRTQKVSCRLICMMLHKLSSQPQFRLSSHPQLSLSSLPLLTLSSQAQLKLSSHPPLRLSSHPQLRLKRRHWTRSIELHTKLSQLGDRKFLHQLVAKVHFQAPMVRKMQVRIVEIACALVISSPILTDYSGRTCPAQTSSVNAALQRFVIVGYHPWYVLPMGSVHGLRDTCLLFE